LHKMNSSHAMDSMDLAVKCQQKEYHQLEDHHQQNITTVMAIMLSKRKETLVIKELMRKFMDLLQTINLFFQNHGEE